MISHGTVPKIFHFINRAGGGGGEGNNVVGKRWQFAYAFIKIIRRGNTTFRGEPGRSGGREFMRAAFVHRHSNHASCNSLRFPLFWRPPPPGIDPVNSSPSAILIPLSRGARIEYSPRFHAILRISKESCKHID